MDYSLKKVYIELTDCCNLNCSICYRHQWIQNPSDMSGDTWMQVLTQIQNIKSVETIVLGGMGEPLLSPYIQQTIVFFKGKEVCITTNGTLIKEKITKDILAGISLLVISIDGMDEQTLQSRGVPFFELISAIDYINNLKQENNQEIPRLDIQFVASISNIEDIFPLMDLLAEKRINNLIISHLLPQHPAQAKDILYQRYNNTTLKQLFHKIRNHSFKRGLRVRFPETELKTERRCAFVYSNATYITSRGEVVPCYRFSHEGSEVVFGRPKTIKQYSFGNIMNNSLEEIWKGNDYVKFRERIYNNHFPSCPDCDFEEGCSLIHNTDFDCDGLEPSCADCLWARKFVFCI